MKILKKIILRIIMLFIPLYFYCVIVDLMIFFVGVEFFDITFELPNYLAFIVLYPFTTYPKNFLVFLIYSSIVKGEINKKVLIIESFLYFVFHLGIYFYYVYDLVLKYKS